MGESEGTQFYNLASHGFDAPSFGASINLGEGLYGMCAERRIPLRSGSLRRERLMSQAVARESGREDPRQLPLPGLETVESSLAVPVCAQEVCLGILCFQSSRHAAFSDEHERMLSIVARHLAAMMEVLGPAGPSPVEVSGRRGPLGSRALATRVKYFESDGSVFLDDEYLIKGAAGRILWSVISTYVNEQREDFSNKEIRLDQNIGLPAIKDNLEARLIALRKRLDERAAGIRIDKTSRGRFRLQIDRELVLEVRE
jgi:adenylate cyclase